MPEGVDYGPIERAAERMAARASVPKEVAREEGLMSDLTATYEYTQTLLKRMEGLRDRLGPVLSNEEQGSDKPAPVSSPPAWSFAEAQVARIQVSLEGLAFEMERLYRDVRV